MCYFLLLLLSYIIYIYIYRKCRKLNGRNVDTIVNLAVCYKRTDEYDKAQELYNKAAQFNKNDPDIYNNLGTLHYAKQNYEEAVSNFLKSLDLRTDGNIYIYIYNLII